MALLVSAGAAYVWKIGALKTTSLGCTDIISLVFAFKEIVWSSLHFTLVKVDVFFISLVTPLGPECVLKYANVTGC
jgi:hypothetical protein